MSSSAQRRRGKWVHREDWTWVSPEETARRFMAKQVKTGYLVALAVLWLPVLAVPGTRGKVVALGSSPRKGFDNMQWRVYRSQLEPRLPDQAGLDYLFVQEYVRGSSLSNDGRDSWRHWVLSV